MRIKVSGNFNKRKQICVKHYKSSCCFWIHRFPIRPSRNWPKDAFGESYSCVNWLSNSYFSNATSKSASPSKTVNQRAVPVKMVISVCKKYCEWTALLLVLNKTQQDNYFSLFLHSLSLTFISAIKFTYFVCTLFLFHTKNISRTSWLRLVRS